MLKEENNKSIDYWSIPDVFTSETCNHLIEVLDKEDKRKAAIVGEDGVAEVIDTEIRNVSKIQLPVFKGPGATLLGAGLFINSQAWNFNLKMGDQVDYLVYEPDGHYVSHVDCKNDPSQELCRKITVLAFLNDDFEGGKFYIEVSSKRHYPPQKKGSVLAFPSYIIHGVEPVTKGVRRSIVAWLVGPYFK